MRWVREGCLVFAGLPDRVGSAFGAKPGSPVRAEQIVPYRSGGQGHLPTCLPAPEAGGKAHAPALEARLPLSLHVHAPSVLQQMGVGPGQCCVLRASFCMTVHSDSPVSICPSVHHAACPGCLCGGLASCIQAPGEKGTRAAGPGWQAPSLPRGPCPPMQQLGALWVPAHCSALLGAGSCLWPCPTWPGRCSLFESKQEVVQAGGPALPGCREAGSSREQLLEQGGGHGVSDLPSACPFPFPWPRVHARLRRGLRRAALRGCRPASLPAPLPARVQTSGFRVRGQQGTERGAGARESPGSAARAEAAPEGAGAAGVGRDNPQRGWSRMKQPADVRSLLNVKAT